MEDRDCTTYERDESIFPKDISSITTIPTNFTSLGDRSFKNYQQLTNIIIPSSVTKLGNAVFHNCRSLKIVENINLCDSDLWRHSSRESVKIPTSVTKFGDFVFYNCTSLMSIEIPPSVTKLGDSVFARCSSLKNVIIPPSVTKLGDFVFFNCRSLATIKIHPSVTELGDYVFDGCNSISNIDIPHSWISLGWNSKQNEPVLLAAAIDSMTSKNLETWTRTRNGDDRLPLSIVAAASLDWEHTKRVFESHKLAIYDYDAVTGLSPFMLAAVGLDSNFEAVYRLCREYPMTIFGL